MHRRLEKPLNMAIEFVLAVLVLIAGLSLPSYGQSGDATLFGVVEDPSGAVVPNASLNVTNVNTGETLNAVANGRGLFSISGLIPGRYFLHAQHAGFGVVEVKDLTLNVGDKRELEVKLPIAQSQQTVQVDGSGETLNTSNATVSTVIDRQFVEDIPLNGRSFQTLILLAPGVVTSSPQGNDDGQFSVNGQRTNANYFMVDGVSANNQASGLSGSATAGMAPSSTALGTTQAILPVDALQEFRIATSSYSAGYGRQPGAQISFQSRSGTNAYHGGVYDYLRNTVFDANNWFNTYTTPQIARPQERQNDFGGFLGGPLSVPKLYSGRDQVFFFVAYEGLRITLPQAATIYYVPSNGTYNTATYANPLYKNMRAIAPSAFQPALNAFPLPNCTTAQNPHCVDYGDGLSPYLFSASSPSRLDTITARIDAQVKPWARVFARYGDSTSTAVSYLTTGPDIVTVKPRTRVFLLGVDSAFRGSLANELRLQYSPSSYVQNYSLAPTGGAQPINLNTAQGLPPVGGETQVIVESPAFGDIGHIYTLNYGSRQFQPNGVDTISWSHAAHFFKAGVDYRQTTTYLNDGKLSRGPGAYYFYESASQMQQNQPQEVETFDLLRQDPTTKNLGLFFQDEWRIHPRLTLSLGLRWDFNPPPSISGAQQYTYTGNVSDPTSMALSKLGAPLYRSVYTDFQPRLGMALVVHDQPGHETVLRGGGGLFYDTVSLSQTIGSGFSYGAGNHQYLGTNYHQPQPFPAPANVIQAPPPPPCSSAGVPPGCSTYALDYIADPHIHPPSSMHWNVSLQQAFGSQQSLTLGYVGSTGRDLINWKEYNISSVNPLFSTFVQYENGPGSSYNALQAQYKRMAFHGLQVLASYTWAHAIDSASSDYALLPVQRGNSSHDVRNNFTAALVYNIPGYVTDRWVRSLTSNWTLALLVVSRSAFPVQANGPTVTDPATGEEFPSRLNYNGQNPYVYKAGVPGRRQFNPAVFSVPTASQNGSGNAPRNFLRGFGETAADFAVQRRFVLRDQWNLQFRAEAFNVLNHPNFGALNVACGTSSLGAACNNAIMGQATNTIADALIGAASIYQQGGPRSLQFTLKLQF
ncbi:MAG: TonB-dependent receptor [Edaphobacter sp.]